MTLALHRHQLLRLSAAGWAQVLDVERDAEARRCLALWAARGFPLVVTRQSDRSLERVAVGLPAPAAFGRRRLSLSIDPTEVAFFGEFPPGEALTPLLRAGARPAWQALLAQLASLATTPATTPATLCVPRVYGGHGWQCLTRQAYLHPGSDIDLLLAVADAANADAACAVLAAAGDVLPRLDGELLFPDGDAVAWREWQALRAGRCDRVLVKRLHDVVLVGLGDIDAGSPC